MTELTIAAPVAGLPLYLASPAGPGPWPGVGYHEASAQDARRRIIAFFDAHLRA